MNPDLSTIRTTFAIGTPVRVKESVIVYHHPEHRNEPLDLKGEEGEVINLVLDWHDRPVSASCPIEVKFSKRFRAHFRADELEVIH